jgi:site-specific DNA recombinase
VIGSVWVYSPDRLSRKYAYQVLLIEEFARHGVEVLFMRSPKAQTPEEQLLLQFQGMIAEYERAQIAERTRRGKCHRARAGSINALSGAPYGYRYVRKSETSNAYYQVLGEQSGRGLPVRCASAEVIHRATAPTVNVPEKTGSRSLCPR